MDDAMHGCQPLGNAALESATGKLGLSFAPQMPICGFELSSLARFPERLTGFRGGAVWDGISCAAGTRWRRDYKARLKQQQHRIRGYLQIKINEAVE